MAQKWYQKASVQTAIVSGVFLLIGIGIPYLFQIPKLNDEIKDLKKENSDKIAEIQRLETQLTPFKTIALEKFAGPEGEALKQLAERIKTIDESLENAKKELEITKQELILKTSDRKLTQEQEQLLIQSLSGISGKVIVKADFADSEANIYANQIKAVLSKTKLEVVNQPYTGIVSLYGKGIGLLVMDVKNTPPHAGAVLKAIKKIEPNAIGTSVKDAKFPQDAVLIWVCHK